MPPDHINIQSPANYDLFSEKYRDRLTIRKLQVELEALTQCYDAISNNLESIFNRIERGDPAELHYTDGRVFVITGTEK